MARVPYQGVPQAEAQVSAPEDEQRIEASPAAFGGLIAEGLQKAGAGALDATKFYTEIAANDANNNYVDGATKIRSHMQSLSGKAALDYLPVAQQQLTDLYDKTKASLSTPAAQLNFDEYSRRYRSMIGGDIQDYGAQQTKAYGHQTNAGTITLNKNLAAQAEISGNPAGLADAQHNLRMAYGMDADLEGLTGDAKQALLLQADRDFAVSRITAAAQTDPPRAQKIYQESASVLAGSPEYDALGNMVKSKTQDSLLGPAADSIVLNAGSPSSAAAPSPNNPGNVKTASAAAAGTQGYVQPATPEAGVALTVNNLRDNYHGMTLSQIGSKWEGEGGEKVSNWIQNVSKSSGIAPDAVPNLNDPAQLHALVSGITTAEKSPQDREKFTPDVIDRGIQSASSGKQDVSIGPKFQQTADYYRSNYSQILQQTDQEAQRLQPDDATFADRLRARVEQRINDTIRQQELSYKVNSDTVYSAFSGLMTKGHQPTSIAEMRAISPQVDQAWTGLQEDNPEAALAIETRLTTANSRGKAAGYGTEFYSLLNRVLAPSTDPNYVSDPSKFLPYVQAGETAPLTNTGFSELNGMLKMRGSPQGESFVQQLRNYLQTAHSQISGSDPMTGVIDHNGDEQFGKFLGTALPQIEAGLKAGKSAAQMFSPKDPDYVGNSIYNFTRPIAKRVQDMMNDQMVQTLYGPKTIPQSQLSVIDQAVKSKQMTGQQASALRGIMQQLADGKINRQQAEEQAVAAVPILMPPPAVPAPN